MARSEVKDSAKHAGAVLGQSAREIAATAREQAGPVSDAMSAAMSAAVDTAAERGRKAKKQSRKRAAELQKQAAKSSKEASKKARKRADKKAHEWADLAAEKTGRKKKRGKGKVLAVLGGGALAAYAVITAKKKQAEQQTYDGPRTPDSDPT